MNLLIFFAVLFATIVLAVVLQRIIHCPILVGFAFFSIFLVIAVILSNTTLVIFSIILGIIAFLSAFFDCLLLQSGFFRNNNCLNCNNNNCNNTCKSKCNCESLENDQRLTILNSNGEIVAKINGDSVTCTSNSNISVGNNSSCDYYNRYR